MQSLARCKKLTTEGVDGLLQVMVIHTNEQGISYRVIADILQVEDDFWASLEPKWRSVFL